MALAGVASAAQQTIDMTGYKYGDGFYLTTTLSAETVTSLIGTASLDKTILGHSVTGVKKYENGNSDETFSYTAALGIKTWDDRNEFHFFKDQEGGQDATKGTAGLSSVAGSEYTWANKHAMNKLFLSDTKNITGAALTYAFAVRDTESTMPYGVAIVMTVCYDDGTWATTLGHSTFYSWESKNGYVAEYKPVELTYDDDYLSIDSSDIVKSTDWTYNSIVAANHAALGIPEPATATLSLLALAGLAMRRRRK
jgi:hypothetical protein